MIDSHCHLNFDSLISNFDSIIKRAIKNKIRAILSINTNPNEFDSHYQLIKKYQSIFISYGLHPEHANKSNIISIEDLKSFSSYDRVVGIGETGLDFYYSDKHKKAQYQTFENHIACSYETNLPLIIHQRNSEKEIMELLDHYNKRKPLKAVFHCFTGSEKLRNFCLDNEFYISLSGIITFKNSDLLRKVISCIPLKWILIETDSPFLAPIPYRGKTNEPSYVKYVGEYLSNLYKISIKEVSSITDDNFYKLFSKAIRYNEIF